jgi:glycosyltransferase involved in cell wall biosynthesis
MKQVSIVIPVYNEKQNIPVVLKAVQGVMSSLPYRYEITFVDDGSNDGTLAVLKQLSAENTGVGFLSFSRNFGHQYALKAGIDHATGDCVISMDGDMQHPPELIPEMLQAWEQGFDVVYTVRKEDKNLSYFKRKSSDLFYTLLNRMADIEMEQGTADFRLLNKNVAAVIRSLSEYDLFFRGLVKWMGFSQMAIEYDPSERLSGNSKYTFKKMMRLAMQGITSFSTRPLYAAAYLGFIISLLSVLYIPYALWSYYFGHVISGWTSVIVTIAFFGGLQLTILGIIGLYLGKLFMQSKQRPLYIVKEKHNHEAP